MEDTYRVQPHILCSGERVVEVNADGRMLLVFMDREGAEDFAANSEFAEWEPVPVGPEEITAACEDNGLALVGFYGLEPDELVVFSVEWIPEVFE
jgi:hypothetical protein